MVVIVIVIVPTTGLMPLPLVVIVVITTTISVFRNVSSIADYNVVKPEAYIKPIYINVQALVIKIILPQTCCELSWGAISLLLLLLSVVVIVVIVVSSLSSCPLMWWLFLFLLLPINISVEQFCVVARC